MNAIRKHTRAVKILKDEVTSPEELLDASPEKVARYLELKGVKLAELDSRINQFAKSLDGKLKLARAAAAKRADAAIARPQRDLSALTDAQLMSRLIEIYGSQEAIPIAARMTKTLARKELECLFLDATDDL